jgi:chemotaxis protein methyltransferase CheR
MARSGSFSTWKAYFVAIVHKQPAIESCESDFSTLSSAEFEQFRKLAYEKFGLDLRSGKEQLVAARLGKKLRELHLRSFQDYYRHVVNDSTGEALISMIDALTTNHTSFFREPAHFDFMRRSICPMLKTRERIAIWSAASSTGEEPYSIVFSLLDELGMGILPKLQLLATDISTRVLANAKKGVYPSARFRDFSPQQLRQYLLRGEGQWKDYYLVKKELRAAVAFQRLNLMEQFSNLPAFPLIFCRNVMIYFDMPTQESLVGRLSDRLEPGGYLFIGHSESLNGLEHGLQYVQPAIYRKPEAGSSARRSSG